MLLYSKMDIELSEKPHCVWLYKNKYQNISMVMESFEQIVVLNLLSLSVIELL